MKTVPIDDLALFKHKQIWAHPHRLDFKKRGWVIDNAFAPTELSVVLNSDAGVKGLMRCMRKYKVSKKFLGEIHIRIEDTVKYKKSRLKKLARYVRLMKLVHYITFESAGDKALMMFYCSEVLDL